MGQNVDLNFRLFEPSFVAETIEGAGLRLEARLERRSYPREADTRRAYLLARRSS